MIIRVISHEVNNSIGGIRSFLELVSSIPSVDGELREVAGACCHRCDSLRQFIEGYSKIVKMGDPDMQRVDLNALLIKIRPFLATLFHDGVGLEYDLSPGELYVAADASYLEQIVVNVVKNAVESIGAARSSGGIVRLSTLSGDCATLLIDDNGAGLSAADSENIFRPFFTTKKKNQGLGLTFVAEALRQQNCRFGLKTLSPGLTRFHVNFSKA